jgi:hypothetical protein
VGVGVGGGVVVGAMKWRGGVLGWFWCCGVREECRGFEKLVWELGWFRFVCGKNGVCWSGGSGVCVGGDIAV